MAAAKQLLIVDDDKNTREGYRTYLSNAGFEVFALERGADALAFARSAAPDLVVLDLALPDLDGWEVARRLKSDEATTSIPVIALSGHSRQHEKVSALRAGCDVYLTKPCQPAQLLSAIRKLLGLSASAADERAEAPEPY